MSEESQHHAPSQTEREGAGVLANLPRTRPQRSSARRIAARDGAAAPAPGSHVHAGEQPQPAHSASPSTAKRAKGARKAPAGARKAGASAGSRSHADSQRAAGSRAPRGRASSRAAAKPHRAPRQGFESEADPTTGPVTPPGGAELLGAATELLAEVAKSGLSRGASTIKGVFGRLRP